MKVLTNTQLMFYRALRSCQKNKWIESDSGLSELAVEMQEKVNWRRLRHVADIHVSNGSGVAGDSQYLASSEHNKVLAPTGYLSLPIAVLERITFTFQDSIRCNGDICWRDLFNPVNDLTTGESLSEVLEWSLGLLLIIVPTLYFSRLKL